MSKIPPSASPRNLFWLWYNRATLQQKERACHEFYQFVTCSEIECLKHAADSSSQEVWQQCTSLRNFSQILRSESQPQLEKSRSLRSKAQKCLSKSQNLKLSREQEQSGQQYEEAIPELVGNEFLHYTSLTDASKNSSIDP